MAIGKRRKSGDAGGASLRRVAATAKTAIADAAATIAKEAASSNDGAGNNAGVDDVCDALANGALPPLRQFSVMFDQERFARPADGAVWRARIDDNLHYYCTNYLLLGLAFWMLLCVVRPSLFVTSVVVLAVGGVLWNDARRVWSLTLGDTHVQFSRGHVLGAYLVISLWLCVRAGGQQLLVTAACWMLSTIAHASLRMRLTSVKLKGKLAKMAHSWFN